MSKKHSSAKQHIVVGKLYSNGCGYCTAMANDWNSMIDKLVKELHLKPDIHSTSNLSDYKKYVSKDGNTVMEVIQIESENMEKDIPYMNKHYLTKSNPLEMPEGVPMLFRIDGQKQIFYYDGERTVDRMKDFYSPSKRMGGGTRRKKRQNKTKKNKTRVRYH